MDMINGELNRARSIPITYNNHAGSEIALFRADHFPAGVKHAIGRCLIAHALDTGQITKSTKAIVIHGAGNTVSAVKSAVDELSLDLKVVAVIYAETSRHMWQRLEQQGIEVVAETPRIEGREGRLSTVEELCRGNKGYIPLEQHEQPKIIEIQRDTFGKRIAEELSPTHLIAGVGTGGTIFGIGEALKQINPDIQIIGVEGVGSTLSLWRAYLSVAGHGFDVQRTAIKSALNNYRIAGMLTSLACYPDNPPDEWFEIEIDFPDEDNGIMGIEGLGVGDPTKLIMEHVSLLTSVKIITDDETASGVQTLKSYGINAVDSAGANLFAARQLAEELKKEGRKGKIVTIVTASK